MTAQHTALVVDRRTSREQIQAEIVWHRGEIDLLLDALLGAEPEPAG